MRRRLRPSSPRLQVHAALQIFVDAALVALSFWLAYRLRFDRGVKGSYLELLQKTIPWVVIGSVIVFAASRMYGKWWRYVGQRDLMVVARTIILTTLALVAAVAVFHPQTRVTSAGVVPVGIPPSVIALFLLLQLVLLCGVRLAARLAHERPRGFRARADARSVLIIGAGDGGRLVLRELLRNPELRLNPVGFVDDDPTKRGIKVEGVRVLGDTGASFTRVLEEVEPDEVMIAIPSAPGTLRARVVSACRERGIPVRTLPTVFELLQGGAGAESSSGRCARCRSRTSWAASPCASSSTAWGATSTARSCSSRAPAARSDRSCAARSRAWRRAS